MKITFIFGTRPEVIKLAPLIRRASERGYFVRIAHTGQHLHLTKPLQTFFGLDSMVDEFIHLDAMLEKPSLTSLSARMLERLDLDSRLRDSDWVVVQGDTTSSFVGAY